MKQYYILSISGSGSMFVTSLFAQYLGTPDQPRISADGNCHNQGQGEWQATDLIELIGNYWQDRRYRKPLLYSHETDLARVRRALPAVHVVLIDYRAEDAERIARQRTVKAHHLEWTPEEYAKLAGADWPAYSPNNILESQLIQDELTELRRQYTVQWLDQIDRGLVDSTVDYQTVMTGPINQRVADIVGQPARPELEAFVEQYQTLNRRLYG